MGAAPELRKRLERRRAAGPHQYLLNDSAARDEESDRTAKVTRQQGCGSGQLGSEHVRGRDAAAIQSFQRCEMAGLQAVDMSIDGWDSPAPCDGKVKMGGGRRRSPTRPAMHSRA